MQPHEERLALMARSGISSLTKEQRNLAAVQHACRERRGTDSACEKVQMGISGACIECLEKAGIEQ